MHMNDYSKITALYSRLSVGNEDRDGGESNSIQNQKKFSESYARQLKLTNLLRKLFQADLVCLQGLFIQPLLSLAEGKIITDV